MQHIDVNADIGEISLQADAELMPFISSANIATGFHAGTAEQMSHAIALCKAHGVAIGAHPSYYDREHFGRRAQQCTEQEIYLLVLYQLGALAALANVQQARIRHVKPHGALYNQSAKEPRVAAAIARAVRDFDDQLFLVGLAQSASLQAAQDIGLRTYAEGFADRRYTDAGQLLDRSQADALIDSESEAILQALQMIQQSTVRSASGQQISMPIDTLCIHGDGPHALRFARAIQAALSQQDISMHSEHR